MPYKDPKINNLEGGWYVVYHDLTVITEHDMPWVKVPRKKDIKIMGLKWRHKQFELSNKGSYIPPGETHMREIAVSNGQQYQVTKQTLVGRFIGYYADDKKVIKRLNYATGKVSIEEIPY